MPIENNEVNKFFPEFFAENALFFEIYTREHPVGFYGIKLLTDNIGEVSVFIEDSFRSKITKGLALACLKFPFLLNLKRFLLKTNLISISRFLSKREGKDVKHLFKHENFNWFEVNNGNF